MAHKSSNTGKKPVEIIDLTGDDKEEVPKAVLTGVAEAKEEEAIQPFDFLKKRECWGCCPGCVPRCAPGACPNFQPNQEAHYDGCFAE